MSFVSPAFFVFLPIVLAGYHLISSRTGKYGFLLAASWLFYASWNPLLLWVLIFPTVVDYASGLLIEELLRACGWMWLLASIVTNLGFLAAFKYADFFLQNSLSLSRWMG